ncbi:hypothetical protein ONS95_011847 [Cadophora gregata]|uniref:uncharacterized protein n=1 Tax=Cadophora gregata TaxID=51156 RepID=UPI0026DD3BEF|nr:uncharacterized protein ONS95_011847 [Cadophora gregata]KAK0117507.1 hypothetical protein ONS95_011847 [Cadophora gregata]
MLPQETLIQIAADPNVETRSFAADMARIGYPEAHRLHEYRYHLRPDGTIGVRIPPENAQAAWEAELAEYVQSAMVMRATQNASTQVPVAIVSPDTQPLPEDFEPPSPQDISQYLSTMLPPSNDYNADTELSSTPTNNPDIQDPPPPTLDPESDHSELSELSDDPRSFSSGSLSVTESDYIDGIMDVPRGRMGCSCPECNGRFSFL